MLFKGFWLEGMAACQQQDNQLADICNFVLLSEAELKMRMNIDV